MTTELSAGELRPPAPVRPPKGADLPRRAQPWAWVVAFGCIVLVGGALGYLLHDSAQANHRYDGARASLSTTRRHTAVTSLQLAQARADLSLLTRQVGDDTTALSQDTSTLEGARASLHAAEAQASQQATLLGALHTCLGGVERALNALAVANRPSAIRAIDAVSQSCSAAVTASG